jgi:hypothetical protein
MLEHSGYSTLAWVLALVLVIGGIAFLIYGLSKKQREKSLRNEPSEPEPDLIIAANIQKIITCGNGTKNLTANIKLKPTRPVTVDILSLYLWGEKYVAKTWKEYEDKRPEQINVTPITITSPKSYIVFFDVPKESAINSENVKIYAFANNKEYYSEPFGIKFEASM